MATASTVNGFTVIPIVYSKSSTHYLYARRHVGSKKNPQKSLPEGRTLFLVNVPPDATERELLLLFKHCGNVEKVVFDLDPAAETMNDDNEEAESDEADAMDEDTADATVLAATEGSEGQQPSRKRRKIAKDTAPKVVPLPSPSLRTQRRSGGTAHIVFLDASSVDRALAPSPPSKPPRAWPSSSEPFGLAHYIALHDALRPPLDAVREHADTYMAAFEHEQQKAKQRSKYKKGEAIVDDDGFTLVTRGGAYGKTLGGGVAVASQKFQRDALKLRREKKKEKAGFYAFQKAEKQRQELIDLKRRWEADKAKVEKLRASRKFKPY